VGGAKATNALPGSDARDFRKLTMPNEKRSIKGGKGSGDSRRLNFRHESKGRGEKTNAMGEPVALHKKNYK